METLPEEMVLELTQHLSERELAACCAVSRAWRAVFNRDVIWRQRCDAALAEHLRDTKCVVEPGFESPEVEDSGLSPVCEERLNYMRHVHLHNNWRLCRSKTFELPPEVKSMTFYNDNLLITHYFNEYTQQHCSRLDTKTVQLWDVQSDPILLSEYLATAYFSELEVCEELIVLKHLGLVQVLTVSNLKLNYRHSFLIPEVARLDTLSSLEKENSERSKISQTVTVGSTEVAISGLPGTNRKLNVWNLKTGEKLKEEKYQNLDYLYRKHHCNGRKVAISVQRSKFFQKILVYDVGRLSFTDFSVNLNSLYSVAVHEEYIAVDASDHIKIYSLATSQLVRRILCTGNIEIFGDNFVFYVAGNLNLINMRSLEEHQLVEGLIHYFQVVSQSISFSKESKQYFLPSYCCTSFLPVKLQNFPHLLNHFAQILSINNHITKVAYLTFWPTHFKYFVLHFW